MFPVDDILNKCDEDIEIPAEYSPKIPQETLISQLNIVKWLRFSSGSVSGLSSAPAAAQIEVARAVTSESKRKSNMEATMKRGLNDYTSYVRKRCKGDILQKIAFSEPYRFFLSGIAAESKTHDEMLTVSFPGRSNMLTY